jgi:hypothetical protein
LAKYTSLVQNVAVSGNVSDPQSWYHNFNWETFAQGKFDAHIDQASNLFEGDTNNGLPVPSSGGNFIFVPENTHALLRQGQSSFYAMHVKYEPQMIVKTVAYNQLVGAIAFTAYDTWDNLSTLPDGTAGRLEGGNQYFYYKAGITGGVTNATTNPAPPASDTYFFANARVFADALWIRANNKPLNDASYNSAAADALLEALNNDPEEGDVDYMIFTDADSFYRLDIGDGDGDGANYGVLRGKAYTATITNIAGPGEPTEADLFNDPEDPVSARTYINVTILAADWEPRSQTGVVQ